MIGHMKGEKALSHADLVLPAWRIRAISFQSVLLFAAVLALPAAAHLSGLPVREVLPMHWPILLAGLCYGWQSGLLLGLIAPGTSYLLSGMPFPHMLPSMTIELAMYGFVAGFLSQNMHWNKLKATAGAILVGRATFIAIVFSTHAVKPPLVEYMKIALVPGIPAALCQCLLLPIAASWWVQREYARSGV